MTTETELQVCNDCGKTYPPTDSPSQSATNPLCHYCYGTRRAAMNAHGYAMRSAILDRADGLGLMARMDGERFRRWLLNHLEEFESWREQLL